VARIFVGDPKGGGCVKESLMCWTNPEGQVVVVVTDLDGRAFNVRLAPADAHAAAMALFDEAAWAATQA
jgi:hypothetical protein